MNCLVKFGKATVVGISGVTCGGKSSLTKLLKKAFPRAAVICQDDYYLPNTVSLPRSLGGVDHANWDSIECIDMVSMMGKIETTLKDMDAFNNLLIIDGFLILNYPSLAQLCNLKYFLTLPFEECWTRRQTRNYDPPDPPGYFHRCAWPMYQRNFQQMKESPYAKDIAFLDGTAPLQDNYQRIMNDIKNLSVA